MNGTLDEKALWCCSYGLYIVTSHFEGSLNGQIANTVFQVTAEPPRIAVSIHKDNLTHEYISKSGEFAVSVLDDSTPMTLIGLFGFKSGRDVDKLSPVAFKRGVTGSPMVTEHALSVMEVKVIDQVDVGTHTIFIGDVVSGEVLQDGRPLTYADYHEIKMGKSPERAPTYRAPAEGAADKSEEGRTEMRKYVCGVCGYIYDPAAGDPDNGVAPGTAFEDLPDNWVCPICGAGKDQFSPQ